MTTTVARRALEVEHDGDPKQHIRDAVDPYLKDIEPLGSLVMVVVYERAKKTKGGILLADSTIQEDHYQGKIGLIVKMGDLAFAEDDEHHWGVKPQVGDWVCYRVGDTFPFIVGDRTCRFVQDVGIKAIVHRPDIIL